MGLNLQEIAKILKDQTHYNISETEIQTVAVCPNIYAVPIWNGGWNLPDFVKVVLIQFQNDDDFTIKEVVSEKEWTGKDYGCVKYKQEEKQTLCRIMSKLEANSDGKRKELETLSVTW